MSKGNVSHSEKVHHYYRIFEQIHENPVMSLYDIAMDTHLSRNTVSKYLKEMYEKNVSVGPYLRMKSAVNYKEYAYLLNFTGPGTAFHELKQVPYVLYAALTFGNWNTLVITNRLLDFSTLKGFENVVNHEVKCSSYTPKPGTIEWDQSFEKVYEQLIQFTPVQTEHKDRRLTVLDWGEDQWKLYSAFNFMRKKVTPVLRKIKVSYETYAQWMKTLEDYCTIHTEFYPEGYQTYSRNCFLFYTDYEESIKSLFSLFPTTSHFIELERNLLVFTHTVSSRVKRGLMCLIYDMKTKKMIRGFKQAAVLSDSLHTF